MRERRVPATPPPPTCTPKPQSTYIETRKVTSPRIYQSSCRVWERQRGCVAASPAPLTQALLLFCALALPIHLSDDSRRRHPRHADADLHDICSKFLCSQLFWLQTFSYFHFQNKGMKACFMVSGGEGKVHTWGWGWGWGRVFGVCMSEMKNFSRFHFTLF